MTEFEHGDTENRENGDGKINHDEHYERREEGERSG
jgi:hypothetical protein